MSNNIILHPTVIVELYEKLQEEYPECLREFKEYGIVPENSFLVEIEQTQGKFKQIIRWRELGHWHSEYQGEWNIL